MLGCVDFMHWMWKNYPAAWHGKFRGQKKDSTIILETVADEETWIWHAFFGWPVFAMTSVFFGSHLSFPT
jgi:hypothetical protein